MKLLSDIITIFGASAMIFVNIVLVKVIYELFRSDNNGI